MPDSRVDVLGLLDAEFEALGGLATADTEVFPCGTTVSGPCGLRKGGRRCERRNSIEYPAYLTVSLGCCKTIATDDSPGRARHQGPRAGLCEGRRGHLHPALSTVSDPRLAKGSDHYSS